MVYSLTWLPEALQKAGLKISEVPDWRTRGRAEMGRVRGVMVHHTVGQRTGNMPSLNLLIRGRPDLNGPLAQLGLGRDGTFYIIAAGKANHAGDGEWRGIKHTGNSNFIGIEAENAGTPDDPWPDAQMDALRRGVAAILQYIGADSTMVCGHKEYAPTRKKDPLWEMAPFRESVAALMAGGVPAAPLIPATDERLRPTIRRGATGAIVQTLQGLLGVNPDGDFGPATEARLRAYQRDQGLVPDGIAGPRTWASIDPGGTAGVGAVGTVVQPAVVASTPVPAPAVAVAASTMPVADDAQHRVTADARFAYGPDGKSFATVHGPGFQVNGETRVDAFVAANPAAGVGVTPSALRCYTGVMGNEGRLEAVNTYDRAFLSFGIMQWTAGPGNGDGELAALLARLQRTDQAVFDECFGRYGLGARAAEGAMTGRLSFDGNDLTTAASKEQLRSKEWTYRFWRAGHNNVVRACEVAHAAGRIGKFIDDPIHNHPLNAWLTSELGIALVLDEHVNAPSHVPGTLDAALGALLVAGSVPADPATWGQAEEDKLVDKYVAQRATTRMTDPVKRSSHLLALSQQGKLSAARHSFV